MKILSINPRYQDGIRLTNGSYKIEVSKTGYNTVIKTIKIQNRNVTKTITLEKSPRRTPRKPTKKYALTINVYPSDSTIQILNINPKYQAGIKLANGIYRIKVSKSGYITVRESIKISNQDVVKMISLEKESPLTITYPKMLLIPGGEFQMGCESNNNCASDQRVHSVVVNDFYMGQTEITRGQYKACVAENICKKSQSKWGKTLANDNHPVVGISWNDAVKYTQWLSEKTGKQYRLPTEAEWEYAARRKALPSYEKKKDRSRWKYTAPVDTSETYKGLYDMYSNVSEWTCSVYKENYNNQENSCAGRDNLSEKRVIRGDSWRQKGEMRPVFFRDWAFVKIADNAVGFRVVFSENVLVSPTVPRPIESFSSPDPVPVMEIPAHELY